MPRDDSLYEAKPTQSALVRALRQGCTGTRISRIASLLTLVTSVGAAQAVPPLPVPVTNAAVASGTINGVHWIVSLLGLDSTKRWLGITRRAHAWTSDTRQWRALPDVPGSGGRLAASAAIVRGRVYLLGGYTVDSAGNERSLATVDIYDPRVRAWRRGADIR